MASVSVALVLGLGGVASAAEAAPTPGDPCTTDTVLPAGLVCVDGVVAEDPAATPEPAVSEPAPEPPPASEPPPADPAPSSPPAEPDPVSTPAVPDNGGGTGATPPVADPGPVDTPTSAPTSGGVPGPATGTTGVTGDGTSGVTGDGTSGGTGGDPTQPPTTLQAAATAATAPAPPRQSLLAAATLATLASGDLPTLAALRAQPLPVGSAGLPLSAYAAPSPVMAGLPLADLPPAQALAVIQSPLLAAGDDAAAGGGLLLTGLSGRAVPGLLVVLATALVAAVGAGNIRQWQERIARRRF
jgi:hypothetical protein